MPTTPDPVMPLTIPAAPAAPAVVLGLPSMTAPAAPAAVSVRVIPPAAATGSLGAGNAKIVFTARQPGAIGNYIVIEIGLPDPTSLLFVSATIKDVQLGEPGGYSYLYVYVVPHGLIAQPAMATFTIPSGASVSADATVVIGGVAISLGGPWTAADGPATNARAAAIAELLNQHGDPIYFAERTGDHCNIWLPAGAAGNSVTLAMAGTTNGCTLDAPAFSGGVDCSTSTAAEVAAALNALPACDVTAIIPAMDGQTPIPDPGMGHVVADVTGLSGGSGISLIPPPAVIPLIP